MSLNTPDYGYGGFHYTARRQRALKECLKLVLPGSAEGKPNPSNVIFHQKSARWSEIYFAVSILPVPISRNCPVCQCTPPHNILVVIHARSHKHHSLPRFSPTVPPFCAVLPPELLKKDGRPSPSPDLACRDDRDCESGGRPTSGKSVPFPQCPSTPPLPGTKALSGKACVPPGTESDMCSAGRFQPGPPNLADVGEPFEHFPACGMKFVSKPTPACRPVGRVTWLATRCGRKREEVSVR